MISEISWKKNDCHELQQNTWFTAELGNSGSNSIQRPVSFILRLRRIRVEGSIAYGLGKVGSGIFICRGRSDDWALDKRPHRISSPKESGSKFTCLRDIPVASIAANCFGNLIVDGQDLVSTTIIDVHLREYKVSHIYPRTHAVLSIPNLPPKVHNPGVINPDFLPSHPMPANLTPSV